MMTTMMVPSVRVSAPSHAMASSSLGQGRRRATQGIVSLPPMNSDSRTAVTVAGRCGRLRQANMWSGGRGHMNSMRCGVRWKALRCLSRADAEEADSAACIPVASEADLTDRGLALLKCLVEHPETFCERVERELEVLRDGLLDEGMDLPQSELREQELRVAGDIIYCWMLAEAYFVDDGIAREMRAMLNRSEEEQLAEGESWRRQLNAAKLMFGKRGAYKLGAVRYSPSIKEQARKAAKEAVDASGDDVVQEEWEKTQGKALAMDREQASLLFCTWAKSGYLDRRLDDRVKLDRIVTGVTNKKSKYYQALVDDMMAQATEDSSATPSPLTSQLVQVRSQQALHALQIHAEQMLSFGDSRPIDSFSQSIPTDFTAIQHLMEEACRCGRSLYDAEKLVSQYIDLLEQLPDTTEP